GDAGALTRAARNLIDNAVRHASSRVDVSVSGNGAQVVLSVRDDGAGIPEADRSRIFERFARLDDARSRGAGGTGLGLAIVREIVRVHGGTVQVEDADPGARFVVRIPTTPRSMPPTRT
ncbi:MAG: sensor histidine kinase, partial [Jiangellaceae bacterium]